MSRSRRTRSTTVDPGPAAALAVGYLALAIGTVLARRAPATGYEPSIYAATPLAFWAAVVLALLLATTITVPRRSPITRGLALGLGGLAILATVCLPVIRGYHYLGESDALTHLGTARDVATGAISPLDVFYPAIHLLGVAISGIAGLELELSMLLVAPAFVAAFLVLVPLTVRVIGLRGRAVAIAAIAGMCLLPINWISVLLMAHPSSMAILYFPAFAVAAALVLREPRLATGLVLALVSGTYVLIHPMHAVNGVAMVGAVVIVVGVQRRADAVTLDGRRAATLATVGTLGIALGAWLGLAVPEQLHRFGRTVAIAAVRGDPADALLYQLDALATIGGDPVVLFLKLFAVSFLFSLLAGGTMAVALFRQWHDGGLADELPATAVRCLSIGFLPVVGLFFVYFFASLEPYEFRQVGFAMAIVTIVGAIAIDRLDRRVAARLSRPTANAALIVVLSVVLLASLLVVYPAAYIYLPMGHITEAQVTGYETAFEIRDGAQPIAYVRSDPGRYSDAIHGASAYERYDFYGGELDRMVPDRFADHDLPGNYTERHYLGVTAADRTRDPHVYRGLRFDERDFAYLDADPAIDRVYANGQFDFYVIHAGGPASGETFDQVERQPPS